MLKEIYFKYKYIIWPVVIGLSSVIILAFVVVPQILEYLNIRNQISDLQSKYSFLEAKAAELESIDESATSENLKVVFTILPTDQEVLRAMAALQSLVAGSGLELQNTNFASTKLSGDKDSFQLNLTVAGQIGNLRNFLIKLQDASRVFQIESIGVQFLRSKSAIEAEIPVTVFYQKTPQALGPIDQKVAQLSDTERQLLGKLSAIVSQPAGTSGAVASDSTVPLGKSNPFE